MNAARPFFTVVAHQDDWQLFMGSEIYARLRDPASRGVFIITTAGNGPHGEFHWKSRLSGALLSVLRALPSWSPYRDRNGEPGLPCGFSVRYEREEINGKIVLLCTVESGDVMRARLYFMHLPDAAGLPGLKRGQAAHTLWPQDVPSRYERWEDFEATVEAIMLREYGEHAGTALVHAAEPDEQRNPGDHLDHRLTSEAVASIARRHAQFSPLWFTMYCNAAKPENIEDEGRAADQRSAIFAYGGGYMAAAAGFGESWRTGWEREYPAFKRREYARPADEPD